MAAENLGDREKNVDFANSLLETEIAQRNARKDAQENTARWIVLTIVGLMTLLLTLSGEGDLLSDQATWLSQVLFVATLAAGGVTVGCAGGTLWPRKYERLGEGGLDQFNKAEFLNQEPHAVMGRVVATRIQIAKKMDELHEQKARWLKRAFAALAATLVFVVAQGVVLGVASPNRRKCSQACSRKGFKEGQGPMDRSSRKPEATVMPTDGFVARGATAYAPLPLGPFTAFHPDGPKPPSGPPYPSLPTVPDTKGPR